MSSHIAILRRAHFVYLVVGLVLMTFVLSACLGALSNSTIATESEPAGETVSENEAEIEAEGAATPSVASSSIVTSSVITSSAVARPAVPTLAPGRMVTGSRVLDGTSTGTAGDEFRLPTVTPTPRAVARLRVTPVPRQGAPRDILGVSTAPAVNLRSGPGTLYPVQGQVGSVDPSFEIVGRSEAGDWLQICCPQNADTPVWISAAFVDVTLPANTTLAALPVPEIPPAPVAPPPAAARGVNQSAADLASAPAVGLPGPGGFGTPGGNNPLTGQALAGGRAGQRPLIVCINNDFAARPQVGTSQADVM
ncbi:MAG: DUF3048 domain-containing protein, partial [Litorilinea sp.]